MQRNSKKPAMRPKKKVMVWKSEHGKKTDSRSEAEALGRTKKRSKSQTNKPGCLAASDEWLHESRNIVRGGMINDEQNES